MAKITHVKQAKQRYEMVPVLDDNGQPKRTPVIDNKTGEQKSSKRGLQFMTVTVADKSKPLPMPTCDSCREEIKVGTPYKHISPKSGPYGGRTLTRHESCPTWNVWEYSNSLSARIAQIQNEAVDVSDINDEDEVRSAVEDIVQQIRDLAEEKREGADNIEQGFGHETESSMALNEVADGLEEWADNVENVDVPELPEPEDEDCDQCQSTGKQECSACNGTGKIEEQEEDCEACEGSGEEDCDNCDGEGHKQADEPTEEQMDEWRGEVESAISDALGDCSVG